VRVPLVDFLCEHLNTMREFIDGQYICPELAERASGGKHGLSESFNRIVKRANIDPLNVKGKGKYKFKRLTFHSLRHSFNSALACHRANENQPQVGDSKPAILRWGDS